MIASEAGSHEGHQVYKSHGVPRSPTKSHRVPWGAMESHGVPQGAMESHGVPWSPMGCHRFTLHKGAFQDALHLHCVWRPPQLPSLQLQSELHNHVLSCPTGGQPPVKHSNMCDTRASSLKEVCSDITTKPLPPSLPPSPFNQTG